MSLRRSMIFSLGDALPLDQVDSTPLVAYGFRKLSSTYTGDCLRAQTRTAITGSCVSNTNTITNIQSGKVSLLDVGMFVYVYNGNDDRSTSSSGTIRTITNINIGTNTITLSGNIANSGGSYTGSLYFAYDIPFENNEFNPLNTNLIKLKDLDTNGDVVVRILYDQSGNNRYLSLRLGVQSVTFTNSQALNDLPHIYKAGSYSTNSGKFCLQPVTTPTNANYPSQLQVYVNDSTSNTDNFLNTATKGITAITKLATTSSNNSNTFNIFSQTNLTRSTTQRGYDGNPYSPSCSSTSSISWYGFRIYYVVSLGIPDLALVPTMRITSSPYLSCTTTTTPFGLFPAGTLEERFKSLTPLETTNSWNNGKSIFSFIDYETTSSPIATFGSYNTTSYGRGYYNGSPGTTTYHIYPRPTFNTSGSNPYMNYHVQELIIFNNSNHTDGVYTGSDERFVIERNMGKYYNVTIL